MKNILEWEKPDLVVVTGDAVSGYAWDGKQTDWYKEEFTNFVQAMLEAN